MKKNILLKKIRSNDGASVTIFGMGLFLVVVLMGIFMIDIGKNVYFRQTQYRNTQNAAQTAIKTQNSIGGLKIEAVNSAIKEYMTLRGGKDGSTNSAFQSRCQISGSYPQITILLDEKRGAGNKSRLKYYSSNGSTMSFTVANLSEFNNVVRNYGQMKVIDIEVTDVVDNYMMGMIGMPCSEITTRASAISSSLFDSEG